MAKNLNRLECPVKSCYDLETHAPGKEIAYIELLPLDYFRQAPDKEAYSGNDSVHLCLSHQQCRFLLGQTMRRLVAVLFDPGY